MPVEPTQEMLAAGVKVLHGPATYKVVGNEGLVTFEAEVAGMYVAMLTAAAKERTEAGRDEPPMSETPDEWWSSVIERAFAQNVSDAYIAWPDLASATERAEAAEKDAARYRWLRAKIRPYIYPTESWYIDGQVLGVGKELDAAIDAAMGETNAE